MKNIFLFAFTVFVFFALHVRAQEANADTKQKPSRDNVPCPKAYLGVNGGFNNPNGILGLSFEVPIINGFAFSAGAGAGLWGTMDYVEGRYYLGPCLRGWALGTGVTHSTGRRNFKPSKDVNTIAGPERISLDLLSQTNVYLSIYRAWNLGKKRNKVFAELGWSTPLKSSSFRQISGDHLTGSEADKIKQWSPGGLLLAGGIYFGIH